MGNRAIITIKDKYLAKDDWPSIYLHWNGGYDTVKPMLDVARQYGIDCESHYGIARLAQMFGNYFGGTLSVGIGSYSGQDLNNGDNGVYIIGDDWEIIEREYHDKPEQLTHDYYEMVESIKEINDPMFIKFKGEK
jgi:hypothetical protein|tara:strand:- start:135 stop:539 length:405 start_codon:yes stop_codon:yes gene_type:complete